MSNQPQARNQGSTPSATDKSQKRAQDGATPPKSPAESRALAVRALYFDKPIIVPGVSGATSSIRVGGPPQGLGSNATVVESIFLYQEKFCINGRFFMPVTAGSLTFYEF